MRILNFGKLSVERIYSAESLDFSNNMAEISGLQTFAGGRGLNISVALCRSGGKEIYHAGFIGTDGEFLRDALRNSGVNVANIKTVDETTAHSLVLLGENAEFKRLNFGGTNLSITKTFADTVLSHFSPNDFLIIDDGVSNYDYIISRAHELGMKIFFAPENIATRIDLNLLDHIFLSEEQAKAISGEAKRDEIVGYFRKNYESLKVLIDFGEKGFIYTDKKQTLFQSAYNVEQIDLTAGFDTFIGYFIATVIKTKKIDEAIKRSSAAKALAIAKKGAAISVPYESDLLAAIENLNEYLTGENNRTLKLKQITEDFINDNIKSAKIKDLSVILGYSEVYTGQLIKAELGIPFSQLLQKRRCEKAAELLKGSRMTVKEIIDEVGYDNETYFRNIFKDFYGITPSEYRKNYE